MEEEFGDMELDIPKDRKSNFNPKIVKKYETDCNDLDKIYPIVYMDAVHFKVRDEHRIVSKAAYICMGIYIDGYKDILIACMDGLKGLPEAIKSLFPNVCIQNCIIHKNRNSVRYVSYKDMKESVSDLKTIYKAPTEEIALSQLDNFKDKWNRFLVFQLGFIHLLLFL